MKFVIQNTDLVKEHYTILARYNEIVYLTHNFTIVCKNSPESLDKICILDYKISLQESAIFAGMKLAHAPPG